MISTAKGFKLIFLDSGQIGELVSFDCQLTKRGNVDITTLAATENNGLPLDIIDPGTIDCEALYNMDRGLPINYPRQIIQLKSNQMIVNFDGFINAFNIGGKVDSFVRANVGIKIAGPISIFPLTPVKQEDNNDVYNEVGELVYSS